MHSGATFMAVAQRISCQVERITDHGDRVYTVELLAGEARRVPVFKPGQFLHLALDEYDPSKSWPESRVFSIASSSQRRDRLTITYSVRGRFTTRMERELKVGRSVWVKLPYGDFVIGYDSDIVLFAGGTGITAFTAFLNNLKPDFPHSVLLAYGARNSQLLIYRDLVQQRAKSVPSLLPFFFIEQDPNNMRLEEDRCEPVGTVGRPSLGALWHSIAKPFDSTFYLAGPPDMLRALSADLSDRGVPGKAIRIDAWE